MLLLTEEKSLVHEVNKSLYFNANENERVRSVLEITIQKVACRIKCNDSIVSEEF